MSNTNKSSKSTENNLILNKIYEIENIDIYEQSVLLYVFKFHLSPHKCFASYETISQRCRMSRRQAIRVIKTLVTKGYLKVTVVKNNTSNTLELNPIWLSVVTHSHQLTSHNDKLVTHSHPTSDSQSPQLVTHSHPNLKDNIKSNKTLAVAQEGAPLRSETEEGVACTAKQKLENLEKMKLLFSNAPREKLNIHKKENTALKGGDYELFLLEKETRLTMNS
jgi:hypothetical protein